MARISRLALAVLVAAALWQPVCALAQPRTHAPIHPDGIPVLEQLIEAASQERMFDLVLLGAANNPAIQRTIAGGWRLTTRSLCVDIRLFLEQRTTIPLTRLGPVPEGAGRHLGDASNERRYQALFAEFGHRFRESTARGEIAVDTIYSALRMSPVRLPPPLFASSGRRGDTITIPGFTEHGLDYVEDIMAAARAMLAQVFQGDLEVKPLTGLPFLRNSDCSTPQLVLSTRYGVEGDWATAHGVGVGLENLRRRVTRGELLPLAELSVERFRATRAARLDAAERQREEAVAEAEALEEFVQRLEGLPPMGEDSAWGAVSVGPPSGGQYAENQPIRVCVAPMPDAAPRFGAEPEAFLHSDAFRDFAMGRRAALNHMQDADEIFAMMRHPRRPCMMALGSAPRMAAIYRALRRDGLAADVSDFIGEGTLIGLHAEGLGFTGRDMDEVLARFFFAATIGDATPRQVESLLAFGVNSRAAYDAAMGRQRASGVGGARDTDGLLVFLADEREAQARRISVARLHQEREQAEQRAAAQAEAARREAERRRAAEFPFVARISCAIGNSGGQVHPCLWSGSTNTQLELRNGADYRMYAVHDVDQAGRSTGAGLEIDLRSRFSINIQNAHDTLILTMQVVRRSDGQEVYRRSVSRFGRLSFSQ